MSISEQLPFYLDIPFNVIEEQVPTWSLATHLTDDTDNIESLPYLVNNFSLIKYHGDKSQLQASSSTPRSIEGFFRGAKSNHRGSGDPDYRSYVAPSQTQALEQAWLGSGKPVDANKILKRGFKNRLKRSSSTGGIDITVVCNEDEMSSEYHDGDSLYGKRDELEFDINVHSNTSVEDLEAIFTTKTDFLHYIGHIKDNTFICEDGTLDVRTLDDTAVDTFLLNGCRSYDQGKALIEAGSTGGIVTYNEVGNENATSVGQVVARLLNRGFSLRSALVVARNHRIVENDYLVVGDGSIEITQSESGTPVLCKITPCKERDKYEITLTTYPTISQGMGSLFSPYLEITESYFLTGGDLPTFILSPDALARFLRLEQLPTIMDDSLIWSTEIELDEL